MARKLTPDEIAVKRVRDAKTALDAANAACEPYVNAAQAANDELAAALRAFDDHVGLTTQPPA
jgi:hypothetical protein